MSLSRSLLNNPVWNQPLLCCTLLHQTQPLHNQFLLNRPLPGKYHLLLSMTHINVEILGKTCSEGWGNVDGNAWGGGDRESGRKGIVYSFFFKYILVCHRYTYMHPLDTNYHSNCGHKSIVWVRWCRWILHPEYIEIVLCMMKWLSVGTGKI